MAQKAGSPPLVCLANDDGTPYVGLGGGGAGSATVIATPTTGTLTDRSSTITLGGNAQLAAPSNSSRKYLLIRNPVSATGPLWFSLVGTATTASPSIRLDAGDTFIMESLFISSSGVSVIAATTGHAFTIWEG